LETRTLVLLPAFKSEPLLGSVLKKMPDRVDKILLVWDEPPQNELEAISNCDRRLIIKIRTTRSGIGTAIMEGINYSLEKNFDYLIVMAGNGKDNPTQIPRFVKLLQEYDYVQGSRWLKGGQSKNLPPLRRFITKFMAVMWSVILRKRITEVTNGFRGFRVNIFKDERIKWNEIKFRGYQLEYYQYRKIMNQM